MLISISLFFIALVLLYFGASWLVKGSMALALKAGVSPLLTGLTIVAFGTSSPELFVSINAALSGHGNIAIGNVIGSNMFNICMILGISAIVSPLTIKMRLLKFDIALLILITVGFMFIFSDRFISRMEGGILLVGFVLYTTKNIILSRRNNNIGISEGFTRAIIKAKVKWHWAAGLVFLGICVLVAGSELLIKGATGIASSLGVGETIIGLTIISAGTSLPVLASTIVATIKKEYDIAVGNIIGSNIFNILGTLGISAMIKPLSAIAISNIDLYVMLGSVLMLLPFIKAQYTLKRDEGIFMIGMYMIYMYYLWPK